MESSVIVKFTKILVLGPSNGKRCGSGGVGSQEYLQSSLWPFIRLLDVSTGRSSVSTVMVNVINLLVYDINVNYNNEWVIYITV